MVIVKYDGNVECDEAKSKLYSDGTFYLSECSINESSPTYSYGIKPPESFATDGWNTIVKAVKTGNTDMYNVGDTKEIALTGFTNEETDSNGLYTIRIANKSNDDTVCKNEKFETSDGTIETYSQTACGFVIEFVDIIKKQKINETITYVGGYPASPMYTYIQNDIYNALPKEVQNSIISTTVVSGHGSASGEINFISKDKLYLLSPKELWGSKFDYDTASDNTRQLEYYKDVANVTTNESSYVGVIKRLNGSDNWWWLRSATSPTNGNVYIVEGDGRWSALATSNNGGVAPAFRLG